MRSVFEQIAFRGEARGPVRSLSGFGKGHRVPDAASPAAVAFVRRAGAELVERSSEGLFGGLRRAFEYRRRDLAVRREPGAVEVRTPDFSLQVRIDLVPEDLTRYALTTEVRDIVSAEALYSAAFAQVFEGRLDRAVCLPHRRIPIEEVIDRVEDQPRDRVRVDFPLDASRCVVTLAGMATQLCFEPGSVTLAAPPNTPLADLLAAGERLPGLLGLDRDARLLDLLLEQ